MIVASILTVRSFTDDFEIIVGNDHSADHTGAVLDELAQLYPQLKVLHHPKNLGYGGNLRSLFAQASKEWVFYTDGDAQYDVRELAVLVPEIRPHVDIVNGYKISRNDPINRVIVGRVYQHLMRWAFGLPIRDVDCDFRLIRRRCFTTVTLESRDGTLPVEMVKKFHDAGFKFAEVPVNHFHRVYGRSQFFNPRRLLRVVKDLSKLWVKLVWHKQGQLMAKTHEPDRI